MLTRGTRLPIFLSVLTIVSSASAQTTSGPSPKVLLIGMDGCRFDALRIAKTEKATEVAIEELANNDLDAMLLYLGLVDVEGHLSGFHPANAKYRKSIEFTDHCIGRVMAAVRSRDDYDREDWLVIVTSDHGGSGRKHQNGRRNPAVFHSMMIVSGRRAKRGKSEAAATSIVDAPVTALAHLGVEIDPKWQLDGRVIGLQPTAEVEMRSEPERSPAH